MTQTIARKISLYDQDLNLWLETAIAQLKAGDLTKPEAIGVELAHQLKDKGAQDILNKIISEFRS